jgi:hypothetical protein
MVGYEKKEERNRLQEGRNRGRKERIEEGKKGGGGG